MRNIEERLQNVEVKTDRLEFLFGHFMVQTGTAIRRLEENSKKMAKRMGKTMSQLQKTVTRLEQQSAEDKREWQQRLAEIDRRNAEMDQRNAEDKREWQQRLAKIDQQNAEDKREWQQRLAEMDQRTAEMDSKWEERFAKENQHWNKRWGELAQKMGTLVEDIVAPNISRLAKTVFGCGELEDFMVRRYVRNKKDRAKRREFDVIAVCQDKVLLNETKATVRIEYTDDFIKMLDEVMDYFPEYQGKQIIPIFSSLQLRQDVVNYLTKHKIYALAMGGETMELLNVAELS